MEYVGFAHKRRTGRKIRRDWEYPNKVEQEIKTINVQECATVAWD